MRALVDQVGSGPPRQERWRPRWRPDSSQGRSRWQEPSPWLQQVRLHEQGVRAQERGKAEQIGGNADADGMGLRGPGPRRRKHCPRRKGCSGDRTRALGPDTARLNKRMSRPRCSSDIHGRGTQKTHGERQARLGRGLSGAVLCSLTPPFPLPGTCSCLTPFPVTLTWSVLTLTCPECKHSSWPLRWPVLPTPGSRAQLLTSPPALPAFLSFRLSHTQRQDEPCKSQLSCDLFNLPRLSSPHTLDKSHNHLLLEDLASRPVASRPPLSFARAFAPAGLSP